MGGRIRVPGEGDDYKRAIINHTSRSLHTSAPTEVTMRESFMFCSRVSGQEERSKEVWGRAGVGDQVTTKSDDERQFE